MTNEEYMELVVKELCDDCGMRAWRCECELPEPIESTDCEDCEWYGSKCHCQTEEPEHGIAGMTDDQIRIAELENQIEVLNHFHQNEINQLKIHNTELVLWIDHLNRMIESINEHLKTRKEQ